MKYWWRWKRRSIFLNNRPSYGVVRIISWHFAIVRQREDHAFPGSFEIGIGIPTGRQGTINGGQPEAIVGSQCHSTEVSPLLVLPASEDGERYITYGLYLLGGESKAQKDRSRRETSARSILFPLHWESAGSGNIA
jgi:hypothetical protein